MVILHQCGEDAERSIGRTEHEGFVVVAGKVKRGRRRKEKKRMSELGFLEKLFKNTLNSKTIFYDF